MFQFCMSQSYEKERKIISFNNIVSSRRNTVDKIKKHKGKQYIQKRASNGNTEQIKALIYCIRARSWTRDSDNRQRRKLLKVKTKTKREKSVKKRNERKHRSVCIKLFSNIYFYLPFASKLDLKKVNSTCEVIVSIESALPLRSQFFIPTWHLLALCMQRKTAMQENQRKVREREKCMRLIESSHCFSDGILYPM